MKSILSIMLLMILCGCDDSVDPNKIDVSSANSKNAEATTLRRFKVESYGYFNAGYQQNGREIVIITDTKTNKKYLSVTGAGVTELHDETEGENTVHKED